MAASGNVKGACAQLIEGSGAFCLLYDIKEGEHNAHFWYSSELPNRIKTWKKQQGTSLSIAVDSSLSSKVQPRPR